MVTPPAVLTVFYHHILYFRIHIPEQSRLDAILAREPMDGWVGKVCTTPEGAPRLGPLCQCCLGHNNDPSRACLPWMAGFPGPLFDMTLGTGSIVLLVGPKRRSILKDRRSRSGRMTSTKLVPMTAMGRSAGGNVMIHRSYR